MMQRINGHMTHMSTRVLKKPAVAHQIKKKPAVVKDYS